MRATKKEKTLLLNDLCEILHLSRSHIARLLRAFGGVIYYKGAKFVAAMSAKDMKTEKEKGCINKKTLKSLTLGR